MMVPMATKNERATPAKESRCIICGEGKNGLEVKEDSVINIIRYFKKNVLKNEKNYRLVVCRQCYPKYSKERSSFTKRRILYVGIGLVFGILAIIIAPLNASSYLIAVLVVGLMYLFSLLSYMPAVIIPEAAKAAAEGQKAALKRNGSRHS